MGLMNHATIYQYIRPTHNCQDRYRYTVCSMSGFSTKRLLYNWIYWVPDKNVSTWFPLHGLMQVPDFHSTASCKYLVPTPRPRRRCRCCCPSCSRPRTSWQSYKIVTKNPDFKHMSCRHLHMLHKRTNILTCYTIIPQISWHVTYTAVRYPVFMLHISYLDTLNMQKMLLLTCNLVAIVSYLKTWQLFYLIWQ
jgi:hypothetical protein